MAIDVMVERSTVLKALAEPVRWRIVERLAGEELCVCHLVDDLGLAQPLVSHHLKVLRVAGLVTSERFKQWVYYRLEAGALDQVATQLSQAAATAKSARRERRPCC
jgi:DNA-binding transcriptional ArsR family regulator